MITLTVKTLDAQNHLFEVEDDITVEQFKVHIADKVNVPADTQRIIYCGRVLQDSTKLKDYNVDGKVVHLVQRPPPSTNSRPNRPVSPPPQPARRFFVDPGNAIHLGSMQIPTNFMESQGFVPPPPTHTLAGSRLNVARRMLRRAEAVIRVLENPSARPSDQSPPEETQEEVTPVIEARVIVPTNSNEPLDEAMVLSAVHDTLLNATGTVGGDNAAASDPQTADASQSQSVSSTPETATPTRSSTENLAAAAEGDQRQESTSSTFPENASRTSEMAELLTMLSNLQLRFAPFLERYHNFMIEDPVVAPEDARQIQAMLTRVSGVLHFLGHAYHSLSDIIINVRSPPPRPLLCRPILIQHSAVVQAGIPIQVEAQINLSTDRPSSEATNTNNAESNGTATQGNTSSESSQPTATVNTGPTISAQIQPVMSFPFLPGTSMRVQYRNVGRSNGTPTNSPQNNNNNVGTADNVTSSSPPNSETSQSRAESTSANTESAPSQENVFNVPNFSNPNVEFFMEVTPEGLRQPAPEMLQTLMQLAGHILERTTAGAASTTTSSQTTADTGNSSETTPSAATPMQSSADAAPAANASAEGTPSAGPAPSLRAGTIQGADLPPELVHSLVRIMDGLIGRSTTETVAAGAQAATDGSPSNTASQPVQNSQARGNTQTNPTTATHTRSTPRPHVHLAQQAMQGGFDPFLPCNSHHLPPRRRLQVHTAHMTDGSRAARTAASGSGNAGPHNHNRTNLGAIVDGVWNYGLWNSLRSEYGSQNGSNNGSRRGSDSPSSVNVANSSTNTSGAIGSNRTRTNNIDGLMRTIELMRQLETEGQAGAQATRGSAGDSSDAANRLRSFPLSEILVELQNARNIPGFRGPTIAQLLQLLPPYDAYNQGESIITDLIMMLAQNLTIGDVFAFNTGQLEPLNRVRTQIADFFNNNVLQNVTGVEGIDRGVDRLLSELQPLLDNFRELPVRDNIDMVRSAETLFRNRLPNIIRLASTLNSSTNSNVRLLVDQCITTVSHLCALTLHCSSTGQRGVEEVFDHIISRYMQGIPSNLEQWTLVSSRIQLRQFMAGLNVPTSILEPYIVRRSESIENRVPSTTTTETDHLLVTTSQEPEPMELDEEQGASGSRTAVNSVSTSTIEDSEPLPNVVIGSEPWHGQVPTDWVPIITRDVQRQRRQSPQRPFSDAYLSGMPSKRRKIVNSSKPQGSLSQAITESVKRAVTATGLTAAAPLDTVAQAAGSSSEVQTAYRSLLRTSVRDKLKKDKDFTPDRFPNASHYFNTH